MQLNAAERVTWQGRFRPPLKDAPIPPRPACGLAWALPLAT
jgi:hypothetical protein